MQPTKKYETIFSETGTNTDSPVNGSYQQHAQPVQVTRGFDVIATEVRAIITKAYEADELNNIQSS